MASTIITSTLLMTAAIIFRKILGKKLNGRLLSFMWAVVFIKLAVPVSIPSSVSVMNLFSERSVNLGTSDLSHSEKDPVSDILRSEYSDVSNSERDRSEISEEFVYIEPATEISHETFMPQREKIDYKKTAYSIYSAVAAILEIAVLMSYIICSVRFSRFEDMDISEKYSGLCFKKSTLGTPAVFGMIRPVILIPQDTDITDRTALDYIILHEKTHIRHHDQLFNLLTLMICCLNWYNLLAWVCRVLYLKDAEKWCDETVIKIIGSENRQSYAKTLLACAEERNRPFMLVSGFGESDIKTRIKAILEDRKLRRGTAAAAAVVIIVIAAVLGTGKAVKAKMTFSDFVPTLNGWDYTQKFSGSNGEAAAVTLNLNNDYGEYKPSNYFHFTIGIDSDEYSISEPHAEIRMTDVESFRVIPDGEKNDNESAVTYNAGFNKDTNDIELAVTFDRSAAPTLTADISYKLKKGIFTVGTYAMTVDYDLRTLDTSSYASSIEHLNHLFTETGFAAKITETGYEISSTDGSTDMRIFFTDFEDSAVVSDSSGRELKLNHFNPLYSMIESVDVTNDGVNDLVITEHITGTGVIQNYWKIIDGESLCEIPVDTGSTEQMIADFVNSSAFADFATGRTKSFTGFDIPEGMGIVEINTDNIFTESDPYLSGNLFLNKEDGSSMYLSENIRIYGGIFVGTNGNRITGRTVFGLVRNETEFSQIYTANVVFRYEDGIFKADDIIYETEGQARVSDEILSICRNYLTDMWNYAANTGDLVPEKYTSDKKAAELMEELKFAFADSVSNDFDSADVQFEDRNIEYGEKNGRTWVCLKDYSVLWQKDGQTVRTDSGYSAYFEFDGTKIMCEYELWKWQRELGITFAPISPPFDIDIQTAIDSIRKNRSHADDINIITELGLPELIYNCTVWDSVFCSDSHLDETAYIGDGYYEYRFSDNDQHISLIEEALDIKLQLCDGYYKCPFSSAAELKENAQRLFSDEYINIAYSEFFSEIKEQNGSLYVRSGGKGYPGGRIANAFIHEMSDDTVDFTATFVNGGIGTYSVRYTVIRENGSLKLHYREF